MEREPYHPLLFAVLRRTLFQIEDELGTPDDQALLELKATILRTLAGIEDRESSRRTTAAQLGRETEGE